jgi:hypothetical protein
MAEILSFAFVLMNVKCASIPGAFMVLCYIVMRHMTDLAGCQSQLRDDVVSLQGLGTLCQFAIDCLEC